jgi:hypothetical protein
MIRTLFAACMLLNATSAIAHPAFDAIVAAGKNKLSELPHRAVETSLSNGTSKKTVASYNPSAAPDRRWTLDSVDGRDPSAIEQGEFRKKKSAAAATKLSELVDPDSLTALEQTANPRRWRFRFKEGKTINGMNLDKFSGLVTLGATGQPVAIDMVLEESMRMKMVFKISRMNMHTDYAQLPNGDLVVQASAMLMDASAAALSLSTSTHTSYELLIKNGSGS